MCDNCRRLAQRHERALVQATRHGCVFVDRDDVDITARAETLVGDAEAMAQVRHDVVFVSEVGTGSGNGFEFNKMPEARYVVEMDSGLPPNEESPPLLD